MIPAAIICIIFLVAPTLLSAPRFARNTVTLLETVRLIFDSYLQGKGLMAIVKMLNADGGIRVSCRCIT